MSRRRMTERPPPSKGGGLREYLSRLLLQAEDFAALVTFLASERSGYITGASIQIDGGYYKGIM